METMLKYYAEVIALIGLVVVGVATPLAAVTVGIDSLVKACRKQELS
jgi:hypothetical protein